MEVVSGGELKLRPTPPPLPPSNCVIVLNQSE